MKQEIKLTEFSHGGGCGCKISPSELNIILKSKKTNFFDKNLLVGYDLCDDAAVYKIENNIAIISTTDFFMPIVDDPFLFGRIAATNAISDIYAMGGKPILALSIFGWPVDKISSKIGKIVIEGGRYACEQAGISLAGGHSIDSPEPIFGLAVTGITNINNIKTNNSAKLGDKIYLTKPIGVGIFSTAQKQKQLKKEHENIAIETMCVLNKIGLDISSLKGVNAITDVTGFGLGGHLLEVCEGSNLTAKLNFSKIPILPHTFEYIELGCIPGGSKRNFKSYGEKISKMTKKQQNIICDPQTSGGLLVIVNNDAEKDFIKISKKHGLTLNPIGNMVNRIENQPLIIVE